MNLKKTIAVGSLGDDISTVLSKLGITQLNSLTELDLSKITNLDDGHLGKLIDLLSKGACPKLMFLKFPPDWRELEKAEIKNIKDGSQDLMMINNQWVICTDNSRGLYSKMLSETMSIIREGIICPPILKDKILKIKEKIMESNMPSKKIKKRTLLFVLEKEGSNFLLNVAISGFDNEFNESLTTKLNEIGVCFQPSRAISNSKMINEQENSLDRTKKIDIFKRLIRYARQNLNDESEQSNLIFEHFGLVKKDIKATLSNPTIIAMYDNWNVWK